MNEKNFIGTIRKCYNCGAILNSFTARCQACGYEISNRLLNATVAEFADNFQELRLRRKNITISFEVNLLNKKGKLKETEWQPFDNEIRQFVENYPLTNSKEDLLELFIFSMSFITDEIKTKYQKIWNEIWSNKLKQIYTKARIAMSNDSGALNYMKKLADEVGVSLS